MRYYLLNERKGKMGVSRRELRTVCSSVYQEVDIVPLREEIRERSEKIRTSAEKQKKANEKNARRNFCRLVAANFVKPGVLLVDPTYEGGQEPASFEEADRNLVNYLRRIAWACKKKKLPAPKYVAVTEGGNQETGEEAKRLHHHIILYAPGLTRDEVEELWKTGRGKKAHSLGRINTRKAQPIEGNLNERAAYMLKAPKHKRRWHQSLGLKKPETKKNDNRYSARQIEQWVRDGRAFDRRFWNKKYPSWNIAEISVEYNDIESMHYIRMRMWREKSPWGK